MCRHLFEFKLGCFCEKKVENRWIKYQNILNRNDQISYDDTTYSLIIHITIYIIKYLMNRNSY